MVIIRTSRILSILVLCLICIFFVCVFQFVLKFLCFLKLFTCGIFYQSFPSEVSASGCEVFWNSFVLKYNPKNSYNADVLNFWISLNLLFELGPEIDLQFSYCRKLFMPLFYFVGCIINFSVVIALYIYPLF